MLLSVNHLAPAIAKLKTHTHPNRRAFLLVGIRDNTGFDHARGGNANPPKANRKKVEGNVAKKETVSKYSLASLLY